VKYFAEGKEQEGSGCDRTGPKQKTHTVQEKAGGPVTGTDFATSRFPQKQQAKANADEYSRIPQKGIV
jgi:hypothetical protein